MPSKFIAFLVVLALASVPAVMGQSSETVETMLIRENSTSSDRDLNMVALELLGKAAGGGNVTDEMYMAFERLMFSGSSNRVTMNGRVANGFPDVRRETAKRLGTVGTAQARNILLRASQSETDPLAMYEILNSLGTINADENGRTVATIVRAVGKFHRAPAPDNHIAMAAVNSLGLIAERDRNSISRDAFIYLLEVKRGPYVPAVRARASEVIDTLR